MSLVELEYGQHRECKTTTYVREFLRCYPSCMCSQTHWHGLPNKRDPAKQRKLEIGHAKTSFEDQCKGIISRPSAEGNHTQLDPLHHVLSQRSLSLDRQR